MLKHGGGVAKAIRVKGGSEIVQDSQSWLEKVGEIPVGAAGFTRGGKLDCKYVVHAVGPRYEKHSPEEADRLLISAVVNALETA